MASWEGMDILPVKTRAGLRAWLSENAETAKSCWVLVSVKPREDTILYLDTVEEALCFGWIDGVKKKISDTETAQRLSPRAKRGNWTELNKERARRLIRLGLMTGAGRKSLPDLSEDAFQIHPQVEAALKSDPAVWANFLSFPALYRRVRVDTIQTELTVYRHPEVFERRLAKFIENTRKGIMYGAWHDDGRLLEDSGM